MSEDTTQMEQIMEESNLREIPQQSIATAHTTPIPQGKMFSEDYVQTLREEAKNNRIAKKNIETRLRDLIGAGKDDDLNDERINSYKASQEQVVNEAFEKANDRMVQAEVKLLEMDGYDSKLVLRLLDKTRLEIEEDGTVKGLKEALEGIEADFPQVKKTQVAARSTNPAYAGQTSEIAQLETDYDVALKAGKTAEAIMLKNKIFQLSKK
ncbi:MAG: hypothetical protein WC319_05395 [Candidatus Paceibacterota bacterium]|jgi:hypothetical protein